MLNKINQAFRKIDNDSWLLIVTYIFLIASLLARVNLSVLILALVFVAITVLRSKAKLAFYLGIFSLSFDQLFISVGFSLKSHMFIFLAVALALLVKSFREKKLPPLPSQAIIVSLIAFMIFSGISIIPAEDKILSIRFLASLFYAISVFYLTTVFINNRESLAHTIVFLAGGMFVSVLITIEQYFAYYFGLSYIGDYNILNPGNFVRPAGLFDHPNFLANFLLVAIPLVITYGFWSVNKKFLKQLFIATSLIALVVTFSRAAYIGISFFLALFFFFTHGIKRILNFSKYLSTIFLLSAVGVVSLFYLVGPYSLTFQNNGDGSGNKAFLNRVSSSVDPDAGTNTERLLIWRAGLNMLNDNPLLGVGLENFRVRYDEYRLPGTVRSGVVAHNTYLQLLIEIGVFGFIAFSSFVLLLLFTSLKSIFKAPVDSLEYYLLWGGLAAFLGVSFQNLTNSVLYYPHTWFLYGFLVATSVIALKKVRKPV